MTTQSNRPSHPLASDSAEHADAAAVHPPRVAPQEHTPSEAPWYRREAWIVVCLLAFVPLLLGLISPKGWHTPLFALSGATFVASVIMLMRMPRASTSR